MSELEHCKIRAERFNELLLKHRISLKLLSEKTGIVQSSLSLYKRMKIPLYEKNFEKIIKGIDEIKTLGIVDESYRIEGKRVIEAKRAVEYEERKEALCSIMDEYKISSRMLAEYSGVSNGSINVYRTGRVKMHKKETFDKLMAAAQKIISLNAPRTTKPKKTKAPIDIYIERNLQRHGNVYVHKSVMKRSEELKTHLKTLQIDCRAILLEDGNYILEDTKRFHTQFAKGIER
jgi:DNA-binding Xre family transcriptional regulator